MVTQISVNCQMVFQVSSDLKRRREIIPVSLFMIDPDIV